MATRSDPDPLAKAVGERIQNLRKEAGLTQEGLAYQSDISSKGFMSEIEAGLAIPSMTTLAAIAERLGVELMDLFCFPEDGPRHELMDRTRNSSDAEVRKTLKHFMK